MKDVTSDMSDSYISIRTCTVLVTAVVLEGRILRDLLSLVRIERERLPEPLQVQTLQGPVQGWLEQQL